MKKPYIICHMMSSLDGRMDCAMTSKLAGVDEYYKTLEALQTPTTLSGRVTAQLELAEPGEFHCKKQNPLGAEGFSKKTAAAGYSVIADTKGILLWKDAVLDGAPLLIVTSEQVGREYLAYLDEKQISWIACGKERIDLARACEILAEEFGISRMAVVGGGHINGSFLDAGLLDEISLLVGPSIDGRGGMPAVFDGLPMDREPVALKLNSIASYDDGAVWLRYTVIPNHPIP